MHAPTARQTRRFRTPSLVLSGACAVLLFAGSGCRTLEYRQIQADFERAVQADNARNPSPFVDWYQQVTDALTPEAIDRLDPRLRPNAWMLRAVSAWRSHELELARQSSRRGLAEPELVPGSRDEIILTMIPALVIDSELMTRLRRADGIAPAAEYGSVYGAGFVTAWDNLDDARAQFRESTPESVRIYWAYHQWRILQNWSQAMARIEPPTDVETRLEAAQQAEQVLGRPLNSAIRDAAISIPEEHPLARLIRLNVGP